MSEPAEASTMRGESRSKKGGGGCHLCYMELLRFSIFQHRATSICDLCLHVVIQHRCVVTFPDGLSRITLGGENIIKYFIVLTSQPPWKFRVSPPGRQWLPDACPPPPKVVDKLLGSLLPQGCSCSCEQTSRILYIICGYQGAGIDTRETPRREGCNTVRLSRWLP